jgi:hypothetical protein
LYIESSDASAKNAASSADAISRCNDLRDSAAGSALVDVAQPMVGGCLLDDEDGRMVFPASCFFTIDMKTR